MKPSINNIWTQNKQIDNNITYDAFRSFVNKANKQYLNTDNPKLKKFKLVIATIILILLLVIILIAGASYLLDDENSRPGAYAGMTQEEKIDYLNQRTKDALVNVNIAANIVFPNGSQEAGYARFVNEETNHLSQKYILRLKDDDEILYESGIVKPGYWIEEIYLNKYLEPGKYDVIVSVVAFDQNNNTLVGQIDSEVKMTIY